jgi:hypothetical protein
VALFAALTVPVMIAAGSGAVSAATVDPTPTISTIANRADLISGPATLVQIGLPAGASMAALSVRLNGDPVTDQFAVRPNGRVQGLLTGLRPGGNVVSATVAGATAQLVITDHPIGGPVFAGPQVQPWFCANQANGAGAPRDAQCDTDPTYTYQYKSSITGQFVGYDPAHPPLDVATTTTDQGVTMPYIVRIETGVIDRGVYQLAVLDTPGQPWAPWAPQPGWNGKLYYQFQGGCTPDHDQGSATGGAAWLDDTSLSRGFLEAISSNTVLGEDCNSVVAAETLMMVKEHIVDEYGSIRYTMSTGCSGGSMQQQWDVSDYPGLLDGIIPSCSFPDIWETVQEAEDCHLLNHAFGGSPPEWVLPTQQDAVTGYEAPTTCLLWDASYARTWLDPTDGASCTGSQTAGLPIGPPNPDWVYDPATNPTGARCTLPDYMVSVFGRRATDSFANSPFDNVGVQYGLNAVNSGQITPQQFADLNALVGGLDIDWHWQPQRSSADPQALSVAYRAGLVTNPRAAADVPILDVRGAEDVEVHTDFHSYAMRARLDQANGDHANQVIWTAPGVQPAVPPAVTTAAFLTMDAWLTAIDADHRPISQADKVGLDKPSAATDSCWINALQITDQATCRAAFPYFADPRIAAGGPLADNVLRCQLKALDRGDYSVTFSDTQWAELQQAFPTGVCDYGRPGVGQQPAVPWTTFAAGPGGTPLGPAPTATPVS